jgi:hypothetical protein
MDGLKLEVPGGADAAPRRIHFGAQPGDTLLKWGRSSLLQASVAGSGVLRRTDITIRRGHHCHHELDLHNIHMIYEGTYRVQSLVYTTLQTEFL